VPFLAPCFVDPAKLPTSSYLVFEIKTFGFSILKIDPLNNFNSYRKPPPSVFSNKASFGKVK